jgi:hypothetical protein
LGGVPAVADEASWSFDADEGLEDQPTLRDLGGLVEQYRVDEMDAGAGVREPGSVDAGTTADVEDLYLDGEMVRIAYSAERKAVADALASLSTEVIWMMTSANGLPRSWLT